MATGSGDGHERSHAPDAPVLESAGDQKVANTAEQEPDLQASDSGAATHLVTELASRTNDDAEASDIVAVIPSEVVIGQSTTATTEPNGAPTETTDDLVGAVASSLLGTNAPGDIPVDSPAEWVLLAAARRELSESDELVASAQHTIATEQTIASAAVEAFSTQDVAVPAQGPGIIAVDAQGTPISAAIKTVGSLVGGALSFISHTLTNTVTFINATIDFGSAAVNFAISAGIQLISGAIHAVGTLVNYAVTTTVNAVNNLFTHNPTPLGNLLVGAASFLGQAVTTTISLVDNTVTATLTFAGAVATTTITVLDAAVTGTAAVLTRTVTVALDVIAAILNPTPEAVGHAPTAADDAVLTAEDLPLVIAANTLLANDSDDDADPLSITATTQGAHGSTSLAANGTITYTPAANFNGTDTFTYTVSDGGNTATATVSVTITPVNDAPTNGSSSVGAPNAATGVVTGTVGATDIDGDTLSYSAPSTTDKGAITLVGNTFIYTPTDAARHAAGAPGASAADTHDSFIVTVDDGRGGTLAIAVTVGIAPPLTGDDNHAPVVGDNAFSFTVDKATGVLTGAVNVSDPDGDRLTYTVGTTPSAHLGSVVVDSTTGTWVYTPTATALTAAYSGQSSLTAEFTVTVSDGRTSTPVAVSAPVTVSADTLVAVLERAGSRPVGVAVGVDGSIYVINSGASTLSVIRPGDSSTSTVHVGASPSAVTVGTDGRVWVANGADSTVTVLSHTGTTIATIGVGASPIGLAIGADGSIYVANASDGTISVINATTNTLARTITTGGTPTGIAAGTDGRIYLADFSANAVTVIDPEHGDALATIANAGANPYGIAVNTDGMVYVTHPIAGTITILTPTATTYEDRTVSVGTTPTAITVGANGSIYVTDTGTNTVTTIDPHTLTTTTIATGTNPNSIAIAPGGKLYVTNGRSDSLTIINPQNASTTTIPVGVDTNTVAIDAMGNLSVTSNYDNTISAINHATAGTVVDGTVITGTVTTGAFTDTGFTVAPDAAYFVASPDSLYAYGTTNGGTVVINPATGTATTFLLGNGQLETVVSPDSRYAYVTNYNSGTVSIINPANGTATTIATGSAPRDLVVSPDSRYAYVINRGSATVSIINPATGTATTISVGDKALDYYALSLTVSPDSRYAYVTNYNSGTVSIINPATGTATTIDTGSGSYSVVVSPDSRYAYVTNLSSDKIAIINPATGTATTVALVETGGASLVVSPDSRYVYVTNYNSGTVSIINPATGTATTVATGSAPRDLVVSPDSRYAYVANYNSGTVSIINPATGTATTVATGSGPNNVVVSQDSRYAYVANSKSGTVSIVNPATGTATTIATGSSSGDGDYLVVSPDSLYAYVRNRTQDTVSIINPANGTATTIATQTERNSAQPLVVSPDGRYAYIKSGYGDSVLIINPATGTATTIATGGTVVGVWANSRYAYVTTTSSTGDSTAMIIEPVTGETTTITIGGGRPVVGVNTDSRYAYVFQGGRGVVTVIDSTKLVFPSAGIAGNYRDSTYVDTPATFDPTVNPFKPSSGVTITGVSTPTHGVATFDGSKITYTPDTGYIGTDTFTYTATNGVSSGTGMITMQVMPVPYEAGPAGTQDLYKTLRDAMDGIGGKSLQHGVYTQHVLVNGQESLIVYIAGTHTLTGDQSVIKNLPSAAGIVDEGQIAVIKAAMTDSNEPILLVGYSQGGMDAQNIATNAAKYGLQNQIKAVVTYGSPLVQIDSYPTVHLEDAADPIPRLPKAVDWGSSLTWVAGVVNSVVNKNVYLVATPNDFDPVVLADLANIGVHGTRSTYEDVGLFFDVDASSHWNSLRSALTAFLNGQVVS